MQSSPEQILQWFILRWNVEVTFEELRAHLGVETQRQWSDLAIERTTPALFGLFSLVVLMALEIIKTVPVPIRSRAWYQKKEATFSDILAMVRKNLWISRLFTSSGENTTLSPFLPKLINSLLDQLCATG